MRRRSRKKNLIPILIITLLTISLGYAFLTQDLTINGTTKVKGNTWDIHFDNVQINSNSVTLSTEDSAAAIDSNDDTLVEYTVTLNTPGDFYEFTVDAVNDGTMDGMIGEIVSKLNGTKISATNPLPSYLKYSVTYGDGLPIHTNEFLLANSTETYRVRVEFTRDIENAELPTTDQTNEFSFGVNYVQADNTAQMAPHPLSFTDDAWSTIIGAVELGITSNYHVGDTKTVNLGSLGTHTLRIANMSTPAECKNTGFSQTACGLVLEFADIITTHNMNDTNINAGGWSSSAMRSYLNNTNSDTSIISLLPEVLRNAIIDTTVISGHSPSSSEENFTTTDKLYLLSYVEIYGSNHNNDTLKMTQTRQLDYYAGVPVTSSSYAGAIKQYNATSYYWWLRSPYSYTSSFDNIHTDGSLNSNSASNTIGVSPAFRIG